MSQVVAESFPIEAKGLSKTYRVGFLMNRTVRALQGLDLRVPEGRIFGLIGPNGAGKSTTIKILMNLVTASSGDAKIFGHAPDHASVRRLVGFLPENPAPYEYLTGREFVTLSGRLSGLSGEELDRRVAEVLGMVEMGKAEKLQIRRYSKGMVQRVALAQALVGRPKLLILDEPTSGLDPLGRKQMRELIVEQRRLGTTILFCTHIIPDVEATCDELAMLVGGRRVREGKVTELLAGHSPLSELVIEGSSRETVAGFGVPLTGIKEADGRLTVTVAEEHGTRLLQAALASGARVIRFTPMRFSLEQLFMDALTEAQGSTVGGEIRA